MNNVQLHKWSMKAVDNMIYKNVYDIYQIIQE